MTDLDRETNAAVEALAHRLRERDAAIRDGAEHADAEVFAAEFMLALRTKGGWRPTAAKSAAVAPKHAPPDGGNPDELLALARARCEEVTAAQADAIRRRQDGAA